jgi:anaerobic ribonucleoside-triphosphate reductase
MSDRAENYINTLSWNVELICVEGTASREARFDLKQYCLYQNISPISSVHRDFASLLNEKQVFPI